MKDVYEILVTDKSVLCFHTRETQIYYVGRVREFSIGEHFTLCRLDKRVLL